MDVNSAERSRLLIRLAKAQKEKEIWRSKSISSVGQCSPKVKKQKKSKNFRHRYALRFMNLLARTMEEARCHVMKLFSGVVGVTFLAARSNQHHFNGWVFFNVKVNLIKAREKILRKKSRKMCFMKFVKIEINDFDRLFAGKMAICRHRKKAAVRTKLPSLKAEKKELNYKHWTLNESGSKIV